MLLLLFFFFWFCLCFCGEIGFYFREKWNNQNALKLSFERLNCYACLRAFFVRITEWSLTCWLCESYSLYSKDVMITQLRFLWKWIFSLEMDVNTTVNEHHTTNKQTDRQQSSILVCSLHRNYVKMFQTLQWNHLLAAGGSIWHLSFENFVIFQ